MCAFTFLLLLGTPEIQSQGTSCDSVYDSCTAMEVAQLKTCLGNARAHYLSAIDNCKAFFDIQRKGGASAEEAGQSIKQCVAQVSATFDSSSKHCNTTFQSGMNRCTQSLRECNGQ